MKDFLDFYLRLGIPIFPVHYIKTDGACSCAGKDKNCTDRGHQGKHPLTSNGFKDATTDKDQIRTWWYHEPTANIGVATGEVSGIIVIDIDPRNNGDVALDDLIRKYGDLPETLTVSTGGGGKHYYFNRPNRKMKFKKEIVKGVDIKSDGGYVIGIGSSHKSGGIYKIEVDAEIADAPDWLIDLMEKKPVTTKQPVVSGLSSSTINNATTKLSSGVRNNTFTSLAGFLLSKEFSYDAAIKALEIENTNRCTPPMDNSEVHSIVSSVYSRYSSNTTLITQPAKAWDKIISDKILYGTVGKVVSLISPYTEADLAAIALQFIVMVGNVVGRKHCFIVSADQHYTNLDLVLVGDSSKGRKGTSFNAVKEIFKHISPSWVDNSIKSGLSSGEGLIYHVRDPYYRQQPKRDKHKNIIGYEDILEDKGVEDRRLTTIESEFATVLKVIKRDGNTLSAILRSAWDDGNLRVLTRNSPLKATDAHISVIAHITKSELLRYLDSTEMANGFGNRFLWAYVTRRQLLPHGANLSEIQDDLKKIANEINEKIQDDLDHGFYVYQFDEQAKNLWCKVYPELSDGKPGVAGNLTSRKEAIALRLATIYAMLDGVRFIQVPHLEAALAIIDYCTATCEFIFGNSSGDPTGDKILIALQSKVEGMTRTQIRDLFQRNKHIDEIERALSVLEKTGSAFCIKDTSNNSERWFATTTSQNTNEEKTGENKNE